MALAMKAGAGPCSRFAAPVKPTSVARLHQNRPYNHKACLLVARAAGEGEEAFDEQDILADLPTPIRRRVMALREMQQRYDDITVQFIRERSELEAKYQKILSPVEDERAAIVSGAAAVPSFDLPDDEEADKGVPDFWLTAMSNHEAIGGLISDRDAEVLSHLKDIRIETQTGEASGFKLVFTFGENPFFTNQTLEKTYFMEASDELIPLKFVGTDISWQPSKDTRVQVVKKRVQDKKLKGKAPAVTVSRTEPCDSFFNFFSPPALPGDDVELDEEEEENLHSLLEADYELGKALQEKVIPNAVKWYTGEDVEYPMYGDDDEEEDEDDDDDEDEDDDDDDDEPVRGKGKGGKGAQSGKGSGKGGKPSAGGEQPKEECKQQ